MRLPALALLMAVSPVWAQFGSAGAPPTMPGWSATAGTAMHPGRSFPGHRSNVVFLGEPWLDSYSTQPQNTYIVLQPQPVAVKPAEPTAPVTPLLIEWRGDRFVRAGSESATRNDSPIARKLVPAKTEDAPPVVLIFRDGHRELVRDYSIVGGSLYASADFAHSGAWMKTIKLSALDLPGTLEINRAAGVPFVLPSAPNVVVVR